MNGEFCLQDNVRPSLQILLGETVIRSCSNHGIGTGADYSISNVDSCLRNCKSLHFIQNLAHILTVEQPNVSTGCGSSKGCLVLPSTDCTSSNTCSTIISHKKVNQSVVEIEIYFKASSNQYSAVGFSTDKKMVFISLNRDVPSN